jgi:glycoprotein endo-alpha-1,2-mannosidase
MKRTPRNAIAVSALRRVCESPSVRRLVFVLFVLLAVPARAAAHPVRSAIFFYPWYSNRVHDGAYAHWQEGDHTPPFDIASAFFPYRGVYSSDDLGVLRAQMRDLRTAGVDEVVSSWWGWGSPEDERLLAVRRVAHRYGLKVAVQLEPYDGRTIDSIAADLRHLRDVGIHDVYVYRAADFSTDEWATLDLNLTGLRAFAQTGLVGFAAKAGFAGVYTYDILTYGGEKFERLCAEAHAVGLLCGPSVGPGYDAQFATGDPRVKPRDDGATYDAMWRAALGAQPDLVTITSYNEWSEGTQIEPAKHGGRYEGYDGAYGLYGRAAAWAYVRRTAYWTSRLAATLTP